MRSIKLFIFTTLMAAILPGMAADLSAASRSEIDALLNRLGASGCQFNRNGSWYSATDAKAHLNKKLNYLIEKKEVASTEQFIALAASSSSMSGKDYQVRCAGGPAVPSATWLKTELQTIRSRPASAK